MSLNPPVHFIGVSGIGMRGVAKLCLQKGWKVSGSDSKFDPEAEKDLTTRGMLVIPEKDDLSTRHLGAVVYSSGVRPGHIQRSFAESHGILWHRSQCLAHFFHERKKRIAVTGTHGKTTTSSWLAHVLNRAFGAGFCVGGVVNTMKTTAELGIGDLFVIEADESDGSMVNYKPTHLIITNLEADHLDYWRSMERLKEGMQQYAQVADEVILCCDDPILKTWKQKAILYGFDERAHLRITNFTSDEQGSTISLGWLGTDLGAFRTRMWGRHNAQNLAAVVALCLRLQMNVETIRELVATFQGAKRRLEYLGSYQGVSWYDDYGHHPTEIHSTMLAVRGAVGSSRKIRLIFQPHRATRLRDLMQEFSVCFDYVDELWLLPLYLAGEDPLEGIDSVHLAENIKRLAPEVKLRLFESFDEAELAAKNESSGVHICVTMGAGDITQLGRRLFS